MSNKILTAVSLTDFTVDVEHASISYFFNVYATDYRYAFRTHDQLVDSESLELGYTVGIDGDAVYWDTLNPSKKILEEESENHTSDPALRSFAGQVYTLIMHERKEINRQCIKQIYLALQSAYALDEYSEEERELILRDIDMIERNFGRYLEP